MISQIILILVLLAIHSVQAQPSLNHLGWLTGTWNRTNARPGRSGVEIWQKISDSEMTGRGINLKGTDTTFVEKLKIIVKDKDIFYVADVPENKALVFFKLTSFSNGSVVFENPQHDFPKKISYELSDAKLKATVSGNGKVIDYWFERK